MWARQLDCSIVAGDPALITSDGPPYKRFTLKQKFAVCDEITEPTVQVVTTGLPGSDPKIALLDVTENVTLRMDKLNSGNAFEFIRLFSELFDHRLCISALSLTIVICESHE